MKIFEIWSKKPTNIWLHRLNKDGSESKMDDAKRYYGTKEEAISHHNHMVDANPGKTISHHLYSSTELGTFKIKLEGKYKK